jgi:hypothetical protein
MMDLPITYSPILYYNEDGERHTYVIEHTQDDYDILLALVYANVPSNSGGVLAWKDYYYNPVTKLMDFRYGVGNQAQLPNYVNCGYFYVGSFHDGSQWYAPYCAEDINALPICAMRQFSDRTIPNTFCREPEFGIKISSKGKWTVIGQIQPVLDDFDAFQCIGAEASAMGYYLEPFGPRSVTLGNTARTGFPDPVTGGKEGNWSLNQVAIGCGASAFQTECVAIGANAYAGQRTSSDDYWHGASLAIGLSSSALNGCTAIGASSVAGMSTWYTDLVTEEGSLSLGQTAISEKGSTAVGAGANASGIYSMALGRSSTCSSNYGLALGYLCKAWGGNSIAIGRETQTGPRTVAIRYSSSNPITQPGTAVLQGLSIYKCNGYQTFSWLDYFGCESPQSIENAWLITVGVDYNNSSKIYHAIRVGDFIVGESAVQYEITGKTIEWDGSISFQVNADPTGDIYYGIVPRNMLEISAAGNYSSGGTLPDFAIGNDGKIDNALYSKNTNPEIDQAIADAMAAHILEYHS